MKLLFKHSTRCPVSRRAKEEVEEYLEAGPVDFEYEFVDVHDHKDRSAEIAEQFGIKHESPQVIVLAEDGTVKWHGSHRAITFEAIKKALN